MKEKTVKREDRESPEVRFALERTYARDGRAVYDFMIRNRQNHLKDCKKAGCEECEDARVLIPYYQAKRRKIRVPRVNNG